jgi:hypothetical protein
MYFAYEKVIHKSKDTESIIERVDDFAFMTLEGKYYLIAYLGNEIEVVLPSSYKDSPYEIHAYAFFLNTTLKKVTIPEGVDAIGDYAFQYCLALTDVSLPNGLKSLGFASFGSCIALEEIALPSSVISIGRSAFAECVALKSMVIPEGVTCIDNYTFNGCTALTSITIPSTVTKIGLNAFQNCNALSRVNISDIEAWCRIEFEDGKANPTFFAHDLYLNGELLTELIVPEGITKINDDTNATKYRYID